ncbi:MAG TPA: sulfatase [Planctomycetota bacterium]
MRLALTLLLAPLAALHAAGDTAQKRPNIVFIFSDDHAIQTIGAYNGRLSEFCRQQAVTPNMDRLAMAGALFPNSFCCNSLCSPSRGAVLTGLHSGANGVRNLGQPVTPGLWMYPAAIRAAGYQNAVFGKWHLGNTPANTDVWKLFPGQGNYWNPAMTGPNGTENLQGYATDLLTDLGLDWLKKRDKSKPFMLMLQHKAPHRPWEPPTRYYRWLSDVTIPEPPTLFDDYSGRGTPAHTQKMEIGREMTLASDLKVHAAKKKVAEAEFQATYGVRNEAFHKANLQGEALTRWKYQEYMKDYLRCVKAVDDSVGKVLDYLKAEGLEDNTVVIYASDQGFYTGEHGWFDKRWIYEESIHMPLIVRWPGVVKPGSRPTALVQNIDYAATFVDIAGGEIPVGLHGKSLVPILRDQPPADWRKSLYYHYYDPGHGVTKHYGVRTDRFTLVNFYPVKEWELYDNEKDPQQMRSVYADPAYAKTVEELKAELERLRLQYEPAFDPQAAEEAPKRKKKDAR